MNTIADVLTRRTQHFSSQLESITETATAAMVDHKQQSQEPQHMDIPGIKRMLSGMKQQIESVLHMLETKTLIASPPAPIPMYQPQENACPLPVVQPQYTYQAETTPPPPEGRLEAKTIEGVFDGQQMIGSDGFAYPVPPNYASKSKMVEGDLLKLTITQAGKRYYKQIGPVERHTLVGELMQDPSGTWVVLVGKILYKVLTASITFHRARTGDTVAIMIPTAGGATWGAFDMVERVEPPVTY